MVPRKFWKQLVFSLRTKVLIKKNSVCSFKEMHTKICYGIKITYLDLLPNIRMKDKIAISLN